MGTAGKPGVYLSFLLIVFAVLLGKGGNLGGNLMQKIECRKVYGARMRLSVSGFGVLR